MVKKGVRILLRIAIILLNLFWFAFIFHHSAQAAVVSAAQSGRFTALLSKVLFFLDPQTVLAAEGLIRKCAHFLEYAVLGGILTMDFAVFDKLRGHWTAILLCGVLTAMIDETIQFFTPGRSCEVRDVWIDFSGVLVGFLGVLCLVGLFQYFFGKRTDG